MAPTSWCEITDVCFATGSRTISKPNNQSLGPEAPLAQAIRENPRNATLTTPSTDTNTDILVDRAQPLKLATFTSKLWKSGKELKVQFLSGSEWQKDQVKTFASLWTQFANIKFNFESSGTPDILLDFEEGGGNTSKVGTDSTTAISNGARSMNLGKINQTNPKEKRRRAILHEFGHALGIVHAQSSPLANIAWNKDIVYKEANEKYKWDKDTVDQNFFEVYTSSEVTGTAFDTSLIMLYSFPKTWTTNGVFADLNTTLSVQDKAYISFCYPKDEYDAKSFNTLELPVQPLPDQKAETVTYLYKNQTFLPSLIHGLNWLDIATGTDIRMKASIEDVKTDRFKAVLQSWGDTKMRSGGMTWLEAQRFPFLQTGEFSPDDRQINGPRPSITKRINFSSAFTKPPKVICFLTMFDLAKGYDWSTKVFPSDIDVKGFTINITSLMNTNLLSARATWLAHPTDQAKVASGRFSTTDIANRKPGQADNSAVKNFGLTFAKVPKVFLALDELNFVYTKDLTCRLGLSDVTNMTLTWSLQSWVNASMNEAGASFFAWEDVI